MWQPIITMLIPLNAFKCSKVRLNAVSAGKVVFQHSRLVSFDSRCYVSKLFLPTIVQPKHAPQSNIMCKGQKLMIEKGLLRQADPGIYHVLPFAMRAVEKLTKLVDEHMSAVGAQKMVMPTLGSAALWKKSGRWDGMGSELFKLKDRHDVDHCLSPTHEEAITSLVAADINLSYRNLPLRLYQITQKFRDERRPRYGLLRAREFLMKDLYTFDTCIESAMLCYEAVCDAYASLFDRLQLDYVKVKGDTGAIGGSLSHEFHLLSSMGEDEVYTCKECGHGANVETTVNGQPECAMKKASADCGMIKAKGIEVGHAFYLGKKYSEVFNTQFRNDKQQTQLVEMGCYGLGVTRIVAAAIEVLSTDTEIRWPNAIAPYQICIILPKEGSKEDSATSTCLTLHDKLITDVSCLKGEIVLDDRQNLSIGKRLNNAYCLGYPLIVVCGKGLLQDEPMFEVHLLNTGEKKFTSMDELIQEASQLAHNL
ncbi:probable proline--tRNA ligase, mitochondrial [Anneissia japonica]|uniref:probable proline--tRNA ligase, mitochondrial n=1 Tax=Anneissia japonica TaxID=1529436 RepID=UPI0014254E2A|nr:probable proline--tRNA ligase, mitochondrial [Anneissia japonica]